uniref:Protein YIPF5 n=1 Tax=Caenorhabditis tropicalis TaxID=1561998 RepID=A0A1I7TS73_9PELO
MSNGFWMDDGQPQQGGWNTQTNQQDMGWGQFDYSQPQQQQQQTGNDYYQQNQQYQQPQNNYYGGQMFMPNNGGGGVVPNATADGEDYENEPPLLEELGINFSHIKEKTIAVLNPTGSATVEVIADQDLAGPLVFVCYLVLHFFFMANYHSDLSTELGGLDVLVFMLL